MNGRSEGGIALHCLADGTIVKVVRDDLGLSARTPPGARLDALVNPAGQDKLNAFVAAVRKDEASFDWEIVLPSGIGFMSLHFAGVLTDDGMMVVAAQSRSALVRMQEELLRINNEQTNTLRAMSKELAIVSSRPYPFTGACSTGATSSS